MGTPNLSRNRWTYNPRNLQTSSLAGDLKSNLIISEPSDPSHLLHCTWISEIAPRNECRLQGLELLHAERKLPYEEISRY